MSRDQYGGRSLFGYRCDGCRSFTEVHVVSKQFELLGDVYNSGHTRVDIGGTFRLVNRYAFLHALDLTARIQNLLDEGYAEIRGFPSLGRQALVGLRASF